MVVCQELDQRFLTRAISWIIYFYYVIHGILLLWAY